MRILPSQRQINHLVHHGISRSRLPAARPVVPVANSVRNCSATPAHDPPCVGAGIGRHVPPLWLILLAIALLIVLITASMCKGDTSTNSSYALHIPTQLPAGTQADRGASPRRVDDLVPARTSEWPTSLILTTVVSKVDHVGVKVDAVNERCREIGTIFANDRKYFDKRISSVETRITDVSRNMRLLPRSIEEVAEQLSSRIAEVSKQQQRSWHELVQLSNVVMQLLFLSVAILVLVVRIAMKPVFAWMTDRFKDTKESPSHPARRFAERRSQDRLVIIPPPEIAFNNLIETAFKNEAIKTKPQTSSPGWNAALSTSTGRFRPENQDYGVVFGVGDKCVVVCGDGVGGCKGGAQASYIAVTEAASYLIYNFGQNPPDAAIPDIVSKAILAAGHALTREAFDACADGLRTTLIVIAATPTNYHYSYIGDGGGMVVRKDGSVENFLIPQKVPGTARNRLAASLGPIISGSPESGSLRVMTGDAMLAGTDGVFDNIDEHFIPSVLAAITSFNGDIKRVAETTIQNFADAEDEFGLLIKDNLTLALAMRIDPT